MKNISNTKPFNFPLSFLLLVCFSLLLQKSLSPATLSAALSILSANLRLCLFCVSIALLRIIYHLFNDTSRVFLLNYACYNPPAHRKCSYAVAEAFVRRNITHQPTLDFMQNIYLKSGIGDETYAPPFIFEKEDIPTLKSAVQEAEEGIFASVDSLLEKTQIDPLSIDIVIVTSGSFSPAPSLTSLIVNRYKLKPSVKTYNLAGMGCSSGVIAVDSAARILRGHKREMNALVVITESITLNWYGGDSRPMLVTNCIFRVGCAAALITNDPRRRRDAKMELVHSLRTHHGADDSAYRAAFQEEDEKGKTGVSLTKDLIRVAGVNLRKHIKILAPRVLPLSELVRYAYSVVVTREPIVPDFTKAFQHLCIHTGGKAVINNVAKVLSLDEEVTEPARMSLYRFGNTSSSLVFYELAYFEAKNRVKKGDKMWMLAFGTGFKVGSLVWKWLQHSNTESDNPWLDCIQKYPLKAY